MSCFSASYCIFILLFSSAGMISSDRIHPQLALFFRRDDFFRPDSSPARSFSPQGLFRPPGFISSSLFFSAGMISPARIHLQLALSFRRDDFFRPDSSPACSFSLQGLFRPPGFIPAGRFFPIRMHLRCKYIAPTKCIPANHPSENVHFRKRAPPGAH